MHDVQFSPAVMEWIHHALTWVGFGTVVGLLAKAIMPGRDPGGAVATLFMGIGGTIIGCSLMMYFTGGERISPLSPLGFAVGTGGAFIILFFYRLLGGGHNLSSRATVKEPYYHRRGHAANSVEQRD